MFIPGVNNKFGCFIVKTMRCDKYVDLLLRGTGFWLSLVAWQTKVVLVPVSHCNVIWAIPGSPIISDYTRFKALEMEKEVSRISKPANIGRVVGALTY